MRRAREKIEAYKHLSPDQKAKLLAALEAKEAAAGGGRQPGPQELRTEVGPLSAQPFCSSPAAGSMPQVLPDTAGAASRGRAQAEERAGGWRGEVCGGHGIVTA